MIVLWYYCSVVLKIKPSKKKSVMNDFEIVVIKLLFLRTSPSSFSFWHKQKWKICHLWSKCGKTRDIVAEEIGMSARSYDNTRKVMMKIDDEEDPEVKSFLEGTLKKKVIAAKKLIDKPVKWRNIWPWKWLKSYTFVRYLAFRNYCIKHKAMTKAEIISEIVNERENWSFRWLQIFSK